MIPNYKPPQKQSNKSDLTLKIIKTADNNLSIMKKSDSSTKISDEENIGNDEINKLNNILNVRKISRNRELNETLRLSSTTPTSPFKITPINTKDMEVEEGMEQETENIALRQLRSINRRHDHDININASNSDKEMSEEPSIYKRVLRKRSSTDAEFDANVSKKTFVKESEIGSKFKNVYINRKRNSVNILENNNTEKWKKTNQSPIKNNTNEINYDKTLLTRAYTPEANSVATKLTTGVSAATTTTIATGTSINSNTQITPEKVNSPSTSRIGLKQISIARPIVSIPKHNDNNLGLHVEILSTSNELTCDQTLEESTVNEANKSINPIINERTLEQTIKQEDGLSTDTINQTEYNADIMTISSKSNTPDLDFLDSLHIKNENMDMISNDLSHNINIANNSAINRLEASAQKYYDMQQDHQLPSSMSQPPPLISVSAPPSLPSSVIQHTFSPLNSLETSSLEIPEERRGIITVRDINKMIEPFNTTGGIIGRTIKRNCDPGTVFFLI